MISDGRIDTLIADKFEDKGLKTGEGSCESSGYTTQDVAIEKNDHGITLTVWMK